MTSDGTPFVDLQRADGATALLLAARMRHFEMVRTLLRFHADPTITADGWRWDPKHEPSRNLLEHDGSQLRQVARASPLMVALMSALDAGSMALLDDRIVRALLFCGGNKAALLNAEAEEDVGTMATAAMTTAELAGFEDGSICKHMRTLLGFNPLERAGSARASWMGSGDGLGPDASLAALGESVQARHPNMPADRAAEAHTVTLAEYLHKMGTAGGPEDFLSRLQEQGVTESMADEGSKLGAMRSLALFLTQTHASTPLGRVRKQAESHVSKLCASCSDELGIGIGLFGVMGLTMKLIDLTTRSAIIEAVKEQLRTLESALTSDEEAVSLSREMGSALERDREEAGASAEDACVVM